MKVIYETNDMVEAYCGIFAVLLIIVPLLALLIYPLGSVETQTDYNLPCYDKNNNLINGVSCTGEIITSTRDKMADSILITLIIIGVIFFGFAINISQKLDKYPEFKEKKLR